MNLHPAVSALLLPASWVFGAVVRFRAWLYRNGILKQKRLNGIVISVGNLTVGGTGKTPFVLCLAEHLAQRGRKIGILMRGYRGANGESDEAQLLRNRLGDKVAFGVGPRRHAEGQRLEAQGVNFFVLDDGFQHLQLARDVNILLLDSTDPFGNGRLLPAGRLREPKSAIARADIVLIMRSAHAPAIEAIVRRYSQAPIFYALAKLDAIEPSGRSRVPAETSEWLGKKMFLFCGLGNPSAFFGDARSWGMEVVGQLAFRDHHRYTQSDADEIERLARAASAEALLCTEKDVFNLRDAAFRALPLFVARIKMETTGAEDFWRALNALLAARHGTQL